MTPTRLRAAMVVLILAAPAALAEGTTEGPRVGASPALDLDRRCQFVDGAEDGWTLDEDNWRGVSPWDPYSVMHYQMPWAFVRCPDPVQPEPGQLAEPDPSAASDPRLAE